MFKQINVLGNSNAGNIPVKVSSVNDQKIKKSGTMSRKSSFGNLLQSNNDDTANYTSASTMSKTERLDIKRLAKVYTKTLVGSWIGDTTKESKTNTNSSEAYSNQKLADDDADYYNNDIINVSLNQGLDEDVENKYSSDQKKTHKYYHLNSKMKIKSTNFKYDSGKDIKTLRANNESTILLKSGSKISVECNNSLANVINSKDDTELGPDSTVINTYNSKSMILAGFPKNVGVSSIVSNIFGGKLEKIIPDFHFEGEDMYIRQLYVSFVNEEDALNFLIFSKTGLFIVCGCKISVKRFNKKSLENDTKFLSQKFQSFTESTVIENQNYFNYDFSRILSLQDKVKEPLELEACRCLILKKVYNKRQKFQPVITASSDYQYRSYSASRPHCLEFNLKEVSYLTAS